VSVDGETRVSLGDTGVKTLGWKALRAQATTQQSTVPKPQRKPDQDEADEEQEEC